jgi:hypothetical protein
MFDKVAAIIATIFGVVTVTTLVLPGRQTPAVIRESGSALSSVIKASLGQG